MSFKDTISSWLFGSKSEKKPDQEELSQTDLAPPADGTPVLKEEPSDPTLLELSAEHPIIRLYNLRSQEIDGLSMPQLRLDDQGILSPDSFRRELNRLRQGATSAAISRLAKAVPKVKDVPTPDLDALPWVFLSSDKLAAWVMVFPPVGQGQEVTSASIRQALEAQSVVYGVDEELADRLPQDENRYFHLFPAAKGRRAVDGLNGSVVDAFPRTVERTVETDEYDQVDYASLNLVQNVEKGDEISRLIPPTIGQPGRTVQDQEIPAKDGKVPALPKGRNTEITEDGLRLVASQAGCVEFTGRSFQVKPTLDISGNVDFSTGNINSLGDVHIHGDVLSGFTVRAMGNIHVDGVVEAGSIVEAGGDLVVVKGILGDEDTVVRAHRSIFSKYMENATVYARENLQTDCIVNCKVYSDGDVVVSSGRGTIIGGQISAARKVEAKVVGSRAEGRTSIFLGGLPCTSFEREVLRQQLKELEDELKKTENRLDSSSKASRMAKERMQLSTGKLKLEKLEMELAEAKDDTRENDRRRLECGLAYPGTEITIGEETLSLKQEYKQCTFKLLSGEIVFI